MVRGYVRHESGAAIQVDEPRARRIRPYFIGVMASLFWVMVEIAGAFSKVY